MKTAAALVVGLIVLGASALWYGTTRSALENSEPVHLAYPGAGFAVAEDFHLANSGRFALEVHTPATSEESGRLHREQPDVPCDLQVTLRGSGGFQISRRIESFHNGGWGSDDLFDPDDLFVLPHGGDYRIELRSTSGGEVFTKRGAIVKLERWEDVGSTLWWTLAIWIGYGSLLCALVISLVIAAHAEAKGRSRDWTT